MEGTTSKPLGQALGRLLDYFIPTEMQVHPGAHRRARMFMMSHVFGPILGSSLPAYLYAMDISRDYRVGVFFALIMTFWIYPPLLRLTGRYQLLSFISVQNLILCVFWACYSYGGLHSPFFSWVLIFPLLAFLYLPTTGVVRNILLLQIFGSSALFVAAILSGLPLPPVDIAELETIGMISMASVAIYFSMMSTYFARMFLEQGAFAKEMTSLLSTSENMQQLTTAARQASVAKANFVASMSHELRTPLNSIIGYSQLLVEEALDEDDAQSLSDLRKINFAGSHLLCLIDDILDYSRIDAGKMPVHRSVGLIGPHFDQWLAAIQQRVARSGVEVKAQIDDLSDVAICTDWTILGNCVRLLGLATCADDNSRLVTIRLSGGENAMLWIDITCSDRNGDNIPARLPRDTFEHDLDTSATKYAGIGIESTLAIRFAQLIDGDISIIEGSSNHSTLRLAVPCRELENLRARAA